MTDTPRVDRAFADDIETIDEARDFARELERKLNTATAALIWAKGELPGKHAKPTPIDRALEVIKGGRL